MTKSCSAIGCRKRHGDPPRHGDHLSFHRLRQEFLANFSSTLFRLQTASEEPILQTRRFTPVLGLCLAAQTVMDVSEALLEEDGLSYVLPYKMSQNPLELLFRRIRRMGGYSDNPNVAQLQHAMRRLMLHNFISPSATGNCTARDDSDDGLLQIRRRKPQRPALSEDEPMLAVVQHLLMTVDPGSSFVDNCVGYISGYVCRKLLETGAIGCGECIGALLCNEDGPPSHEVMGLVKVRDNGGLLIPSASTYAIVVSAERHLTALRKCGAMDGSNLSLIIQCSVLTGVQDHMFAPRVGQCHAVVMVKQIVARYLRVRLYAYAKNVTLSGLHSAHKRHNLCKQVLFAHQ